MESGDHPEAVVRMEEAVHGGARCERSRCSSGSASLERGTAHLPDHSAARSAAQHLTRLTSEIISEVAERLRDSGPGAAGPGSGTGRHRLSGGYQGAGHDYQVAGQD